MLNQKNIETIHCLCTYMLHIFYMYFTMLSLFCFFVLFLYRFNCNAFITKKRQEKKTKKENKRKSFK